MSANIFGNRFLGIREPAWHELGTVLTEPCSAEDGLKLINADFVVQKQPLMVTVQTLFGEQTVPYEGKYAIIREPLVDDPEYRIFGTCGASYEIIQRRDFAKALDKLTAKWPLETIGILGKGESVFFTLDAGSIEIKGEEVHQYFLVSDKVDGKTSTKIIFTPVRVVCQNTLTSGLRQATMTAILEHRMGVNQDFNFRIDLINKMAEAQRHTIEVFEKMANTKLDHDQVAKVFEAAYPYPIMPKKMDLLESIDEDDELLNPLREQGLRAKDSYDYYRQRADGFRDAADELFGRLNDGNSQLANTAWYAWQAVTELADWRNGSDSVPESALFGSRMKEKVRAFNTAINFIN